jgi:hypothetical protein
MGAGYDSHGSPAWLSVSPREEHRSSSLKNWGGEEYTFNLGILSHPSNVDFESKLSKVGVDKVDSCDKCIAIREGKGIVLNI